MKVKSLPAILTCVHIFIVQGLGRNDKLGNDTASDTSRRLLNGENADPENFRFVVKLESGDEACAGFVISDYFILTAAHCAPSAECEKIKIFPSNWLEGMTSKIHPVQCYTPENYVYGKDVDDIAVIKTSENLLEDEDFESIHLPVQGTRHHLGTSALIVGWGVTADGNPPERLLRGDAQTEDWDTCNYKFKHSRPECISDEVCPVSDIPKTSICTRAKDSASTNVCNGHSGGLVLIEGLIAGIMFGDNRTEPRSTSCEIDTPSLHTNVVDFLPWIYDTIDIEKDASKIPVPEEIM